MSEVAFPPQQRLASPVETVAVLVVMLLFMLLVLMIGIASNVTSSELTMLALALLTIFICLVPLITSRSRPVLERHILLSLWSAGAAVYFGVPVFTQYFLISEPVEKHFAPMVVGALIISAALYVAFQRQGYDLPLGSNSAYLVNLVMSILYILLVLNLRDSKLLSIPIGWLKGLGTGMVTVFVFLAYPENLFVQVISIIVAVLDAIYMVLLYRRQRGPTGAVASNS